MLRLWFGRMVHQPGGLYNLQNGELSSISQMMLPHQVQLLIKL